MAGRRDVSLEDLLGIVMKTQSFQHFMHGGGYVHDYVKNAYDEMRRTIAQEPQRFWRPERRDTIRDSYTEIFADVRQRSEEQFFAMVQSELFSDEQLYRCEGDIFAVLGAGAASRSKEVISPVNERGVGLRQAVRLFRNAGFDVRWRTERTIERCAKAAHRVYFEAGQIVSRQAWDDVQRSEYDRINTPC